MVAAIEVGVVVDVVNGEEAVVGLTAAGAAGAVVVKDGGFGCWAESTDAGGDDVSALVGGFSAGGADF
jgi:hypothetical protein